MPRDRSRAPAGRSARRGADRRQPALRHQRDLERHHPRQYAQSLTSMEVLLALKDSIESDARMDAKQKKAWIDHLVHGAQGVLQPLGQGGRAPGAVRLLRGGGAAAAREVSRRGRGLARSPPGRATRSPARRAPPDERFLRSVEEKIKVSDSGKLSFRQEVVRKAMVRLQGRREVHARQPRAHARGHRAVSVRGAARRAAARDLDARAPTTRRGRRSRWCSSAWSTSTATTSTAPRKR